MTLPALSCIMPTRDRRPFVAQALRYFLRQDYPGAELIVVDDGHDDVADLMPDDPRIRYVRLRSPQTIGAKRNLACAQAAGELIAHWDDDDWSAPDRLRRQAAALLAAGADACGLSELLHYRPRQADGWLYRGGGRVAGCSIVYRRAAWSEHRFPEVSLGEDSAFLGGLAPGRVLALADRTLMIAVRHDRNTTALPLGTPQWEPASLDEIGALLGDDRAFYGCLRTRRTPPPPPRPPAQAIAVAAAFDVTTGYGSSGEYLVLSLARAGADVRAVPLSLRPGGLSDELLGLTRRPPADREPTIYHSWPRPDLAPFCDGRDLFISTMYEGSRLPAAWVPALERARAVIAPSAFVARSCRVAGVTRPVAVVPLGADPDVYHWQPREPRDGLVTLIVGPVDDRKHARLAIAAWKAAFAQDAAARLVIKTAYGYRNYVPDDPRISYVDRVEARRGIAGFYRDADVLLALGSEGFGLPLVEGMCTGLPVVALDAEGQADVCRDAPELVLRVPAAGREPHDGAGALRSVPDYDAVVRHLRWLAAHRAEAHALGRAASEWATERRSAWAVGPRVLDVVAAAASRPLRRPAAWTLWVPSAGRPCGIAAYAERLRRSLPAARLSAAEPPLAARAVVHVQHEPSLFDEARLGRFLSRARAAGAAVAVTQHTVGERPAPWERQAGALVAPTRRGAARLRARCPGVPVAYIPLGCETWSPPRKRRRGRTIGWFGFPGPHKGLGRVGAALRELGGCELLLLGHGCAAAAWPAGLPVRCEPAWLPLPEIAARLAAEADALVFHYDEIAHSSASSAVLLGLSTGVPVLTSDTSWFADLGAAVHRAPPHAVAAELERLLEDDDLRAATTAAAREHCAASSWSRTAARHVDLWNSM